MSGHSKADREWQRKLMDDYYDHRFREIVEPLDLAMQRWKAGQLSHAELDRAIHETHKEMQHLWSTFSQSRSFLVGLIKMDEDWYAAWLAEHPAPPAH